MPVLMVEGETALDFVAILQRHGLAKKTDKSLATISNHTRRM
jgi:hypothetical protein